VRPSGQKAALFTPWAVECVSDGGRHFNLLPHFTPARHFSALLFQPGALQAGSRPTLSVP
jgi:hypothetical protein